MSALDITMLAVFETVGLILIARLWRRPSGGWFRKIFWTVILLVPLVGPLLYCFITLNPSEHGDDVGGHSSGYGTGDSGPDH